MPAKTRKLLAPALSLSFLTMAFRFGREGIAWFWSAQPIVAVILAAGAATAWAFLVDSLRTRPQ